MPTRVDFTEATDRNAADKYRVLQAASLIELFRRDRGREPVTLAEFTDWSTATDLPKRIDPFAILTPEQIHKVLTE